METTKECKICKSKSKFVFEKLVLNKYKIKYFKCTECELIEPESPFWLDEAYENVIAELDIGALSRNIEYSNKIEKILLNNFDCSKDFLDFGGGYGLFTRLMRDKGFSFYSTDMYCENIFADFFDAKNYPTKLKYELLTTFEVFEHLIDPVNEIKRMFEYSDTILFSTELQPNSKIEDWWYIVPETGQHISLYSYKTLEKISKILNVEFYSKDSLHIFTKLQLKKNPFIENKKELNNPKLVSLTWRDFETIKKSLSEIKQNNVNIKNKTDIQNPEIIITKQVILSLENKIKEQEKELTSINKVLTAISKELLILRQKYFVLENSRGWRLILKLRKIFHVLFPQNTIQYIVLRKVYNLSKRVFVKPNEKIDSKIVRNIKSNSKKILYIGHSYHNKTKSTLFLIDYLKEHFEVEEISDNSWQGNDYPDLSFVDDSYLAIIIFQQIPKISILNKIKHDNIILFPMYDSYSALRFEEWKDLSKYKIINFSKTIHDQLIKWGFNSLYVQYFPESNEFIPGNKNELFFWQRITPVNFNTVKSIIKDSKVNIHIHKAVDPENNFLQPSASDENKYHITYSEWFKNKSDLLDLIKSKAIYFAPRIKEGIGQSFLEAMSLGKAVIAPNNPTMNEYIKHNVNGYLYDVNNPKEINLSNLSIIQKNAYESIKNGNKKWHEEKIKIIEFIYKP